MNQSSNLKPVYDLEERTFLFAKSVRMFVKSIPKTSSSFDDIKQPVRSSGSVGANYREANEAFSKKEFLLRIKISRKEAKESSYWLRLIIETTDLPDRVIALKLLQESSELTKMFSAIAEKSK